MSMGTKIVLVISLIAILLMGVISFDDVSADKDEKKEKLTKLQKECAKDPKNPQKIKPDCELLELIDDGGSDPRADSFFDVFFDVESYSVDSFFDIFTDLQTDVDRIDGHVTVLKGQADSFFGQSCDVGDVVTGTNPDGTIICKTGEQGPQGETGPAATFISQVCPAGEVMIGIESNGMIVCNGSNSNPTTCDPNGDSKITSLELLNYVTGEGFRLDQTGAQLIIGTIDINRNGSIDSQLELDALNIYFAQQGISECVLIFPELNMCMAASDCLPEINAISSCDSGLCLYSCKPGFFDLNMDLGIPMGNGCESTSSQ